MSSNPSRLRRRVGHSGLSLLVLAAGSSLLWTASTGAAFAGPAAPEPVCADGACVVSFGSTGAVQTWTVPAGITAISASVAGAAGGSASEPSIAGSGGRTTGTIAVKPGDELSLVTGAAGTNAVGSAGAVGAYGGGGAGGNNLNAAPATGGASGGGGSFLFDGSTLLLAAGGGGGSSEVQAGGAGGAADQPATAGVTAIFGGNGGQPGTIDANGAGGTPSGTAGTGDVTSATNLAVAGDGGVSALPAFPFFNPQGTPGAGGGGGFHAGGGGAGPVGYLPPGILTNGAGGGGGAGFAAESVTDVVGTAGAQAGDGLITLSYDDGPSPQSITFTSSFDGAIVGGASRNVSAEGSGADPVAFSIDPTTTSGACTIAGRAVTFVHVGTCVIAADQAADAQHAAGHNVLSFAIGQGNQTITFAPLPETGAVGDTEELSATGETKSGSPVVFSLGAATTAGACEIDGTTLTLTGKGTCAVLAAQAGTADYKAAITLVHEVTVNLVATTTLVTFDEDAPVFGQPVTATATVTGATPGTVQFSVDGDPVGDPVDVVDGKASLALPATLGATGHPVKAVFTPTDAETYATSSTMATLAVGQARTTTTVTVRADEASATVTAVGPGSGTPEGTVRFTVGDGTPSAPVTLVRGKATFPGTIPANTPVSVVYGGDDDFAGSTGSTLRQNPTIEATVSSEFPRSPSGWYRSAVKVSFTCTVGSAPLTADCPASVTLSDDGASQSVIKTIIAEDGGIATASVTGLNIDTTKPLVSPLFIEEGDRFFSTAPEAGCYATDELSGVLGCAGSRKVKDKAVTYSVIAVDQAGNQSTLEVHATTYVRGITDAPYVDGAYEVRAGQAVTLVAKSSKQARVMTPTLSPKKPTKNGAKFKATEVKGEWALGYTIPKTLKTGKTYNLGIRTSSKYTVKLRVIA